ncbi:MAG TPA: Holliday junction branch migration protein RuvA [Dehalococcoidia bacterium]|nr:Holliday junction branch migration protein RuvA [Dehalococcoidia bacterium]
MISHLRGVLARKNKAASSIELDVGGVWYEVELPAFAWEEIDGVEPGEPLELETFYFVTANAPIPRLLGFLREVEREFFKKLVTVPNVGPTTATKALVTSVGTIARWIENGDTVALSKLPGIGRRTADTIVAQLRGKVTEEALLAGEGEVPGARAGVAAAARDVLKDAAEALQGLGYTRTEAERILREVDEEERPETVEAAVRGALRRAGR